jgi:23S rRNA pseudouridine1911/1915/1917 synthase
MSIARRQGRSAKTDYRVLRSSAAVSLVECTLHSGRTHQIRVHLHDLGHPVLGDKLYAGKRAGNFSRQMLHAWKLSFRHPRTGEALSFTAPIPTDFAAATPE